MNTDEAGIVEDIRALNRSDIWINGGFFAFRNEIFDYIQPGDELVREPFQRLIEKRALLGFRYRGFWQCMDTFQGQTTAGGTQPRSRALEGLAAGSSRVAE